MLLQAATGEGKPWKRHLRPPASPDGMGTQRLTPFADEADVHCARSKSDGARRHRIQPL